MREEERMSGEVRREGRTIEETKAKENRRNTKHMVNKEPKAKSSEQGEER